MSKNSGDYTTQVGDTSLPPPPGNAGDLPAETTDVCDADGDPSDYGNYASNDYEWSPSPSEGEAR